MYYTTILTLRVKNMTKYSEKHHNSQNKCLIPLQHTTRL